MDFSYLLEIAKQNSDEAGKKATVKRYNTSLKPAKKEAKGNVRSSAIRSFLARKEEEEKLKEVEANQKKTELLSLRAQSTKNSKKAKLMTSRTKDNDYSKIKLSEEEEQLKKQREIELQRRMITDKIERMKARIEMEEKEKLLPRKRKRKTHLKNDDEKEKLNVVDEIERYLMNDAEPDQSQSMMEQKKKMPVSAPPPMNFHDLLKLASKKQHEPIPAPKIVKTEERPMTEKEKRLHEEVELRKKGKSVYSLPQYNKTKKIKANSENNINKTSISSKSSNGLTHQEQLKHVVNNANVNGKSAPITERRLISHNENSRLLDNRKLLGHTSKLKNDLSRKPSEYSEDEDEDLADFIDDEEEEYDVSSQIREIFKYDRNRYISDDDDDIMETPFSEQMKEECRSAKIGRQEDLEDMRREEEEERLRKLKKRKNTR